VNASDIHHNAIPETRQVDIGMVLRRQNNGVDGDRLVVFIDERDLALRIRTQPRQCTVLANFCLPANQSV